MRHAALALALLLGSSAFAEDQASVGFVALINKDDHNRYGMQNEYIVDDTATAHRVAFLTLDSFTNVAVGKDGRKLTLRIKFKNFIPTPDFAAPTIGIVLTPAMVGRKLSIVRSYAFGRPLAELRDVTDTGLEGLFEYPDRSLAFAHREDLLAPPQRVALFLQDTTHEDAGVIRSLIEGLGSEQRSDLYAKYRMDKSLATLSVFPGFGAGSYAERDYGFGLVFTAGELASLSLASASGALLCLNIVPVLMLPYAKGPFFDNDTNIKLGTLFVGSLVVFALTKGASVARATEYPKEFNDRIAALLKVPRENRQP